MITAIKLNILKLIFTYVSSMTLIRDLDMSLHFYCVQRGRVEWLLACYQNKNMCFVLFNVVQTPEEVSQKILKIGLKNFGYFSLLVAQTFFEYLFLSFKLNQLENDV